MNVAEVLVETLAKAGVRRVYGLPGDSANAITDSLRQHPAMRWVHVRHEETAAFAAAADAHLTGELAVVLGSCGPGNLHFINGLYDCQRSRVPVLAIATQIPSTEIGTQYGRCVTKPEELRPALKAAFAHDGPALVDVHVHRRELSIPPTIKAQQAEGFTLYLTKCILHGKGDELIDLAKTNLLDRIFR